MIYGTDIGDSSHISPFQILEFLSPHQVLIDFPGKPKPRRIEWLKRILNSNGEGS
jgi:hypothetical protein